MKAIKESVLSSTNSGKAEYNKKVVEKLYTKLKASTNNEDKKIDCFCRKLNEGDIVLYTNGDVIPCYVVSLKDPDDEDAIILYSAVTKRTFSEYSTNVLKLDDPEKYLK